MTQAIRYLSEADVVSVLDMPRAIDSLAATLALQGRGLARNVPKALATWGDGSSMHALGSVVQGTGGVCGFKSWVHTRQGGGSVFTLFDAERGTLLAVIEARALGMLRTAAITGLATRMLAPETAQHAALIGTGPQAVTQLAALAAVRNLQSIRVYSPTPEKRAEFVRQAQARYEFPIVEAITLDRALAGAEIVTLITRAEHPFVNAAALRDCRHLNAVGQFCRPRRSSRRTSSSLPTSWLLMILRTRVAVPANSANAMAQAMTRGRACRCCPISWQAIQARHVRRRHE